MADIVFRGNWPNDVRTIVEPHLSLYAPLVPGWCRILYVRFEAGDGETSATIVTSIEGRWATMRVQAAWMDEIPDDRARAIMHEIAHLYVEPMRTVFTDLVNKGIEGDRFKGFAWERWKEAWEGTVEDLAWALTTTRKEP